MGLLSLGVLLLTIAFLVYASPTMSWMPLSGWFVSKQQKVDADDSGGDEARNDEAGLEEQTTPRAEATKPTVQPPSFTLSGIDEPGKDSGPSRIAPLGAEHATQPSQMLPPPKPVSGARNGLMPPPSRPAPPPKASPAASLRLPSTGPLPNRGPPANSQQRVQGGLAPNATSKASSARGKVLLSPGHSPMDWAALAKQGNLSGVATFQRVTPGQLKTMTGRKGKPAWSSWQGRVYNITPYLPFHPGGEAELMKAAGRDGTKLFMDVHPWVNWENMLSSCLVGVMVPESFGQSDGSSLEDMD